MYAATEAKVMAAAFVAVMAKMLKRDNNGCKEVGSGCGNGESGGKGGSDGKSNSSSDGDGNSVMLMEISFMDNGR
jgi:hypothetical protein